MTVVDMTAGQISASVTRSSIRSWAIPAAILVAIEYAFALIIGARIGFRYNIPFGDYAIIGGGIGCAGVTLFALAKFACYAIEREERPVARLIVDFPRCYAFVIGTFLISIEMAVLMWTKIMLPIATPFWAGPVIAEIDHFLFREDPWRLALALFGRLTPAIDCAYMMWILVKFTTLAVLLALPESRRKTQALIAYFLIMAFTAIGQYLLSCGGPVFFGRLGFGDRFAQLPIEPWVKVTTSYLWEDYLRGGGNIGGGISAMPSLHVAIALWFALVVRAYAPRWAYLGFLYYAMILVGSVLLGWHFACDGIVATAITLSAWGLAGRPMQRTGLSLPFTRRTLGAA